ncbi:MAG: peptide chain release factor N(5)-glutamine methyltransferase [Planctomycetota bacterium]
MPTWTTQQLLQWTTGAFEKKRLDAPRVQAEMLLAHTLSCKRLELYMHPERPASDLERATFRGLVERALNHEPVDYLVGHAPFFALDLKVDQRVLIPRPSTETLVEHVLQHQRRTPGFAHPVAVDLCTGSGAIAIALAVNWTKQKLTPQIIATDLSQDALDLAAENAKTHQIDHRIEFRQGDLLEPIGQLKAHYLLANPPYIPDHEWAAVDPTVKDHEPELALRGGPDGLDLVRPLIQHAKQHLHPNGQLAIEIASVSAPDAQQLAHDAGLKNIAILPDHEAKPRVLVASA